MLTTVAMTPHLPRVAPQIAHMPAGVNHWPVERAPYASKPEESRGRLHPEPEHEMRSPFQRDRDRIIHSTAFRRLKHKTQVFVYHEGDHYRTRLTHSLEVAQIARSISRVLGLEEDLAEALALAHDLGHTPFGHAGEEALNAEMSDDIAYNNHDIDDGLRAGLFGVADLADVPLVGPVFAEVAARYPGLEETRLIHESIRRMIDRMVRDLVAETRARLSDGNVRSADDIRALGHPVAAFSDAMRDNDRALKRFLYERMYRHYRVNRMSLQARRVVHELFQLFIAEP